MNGNPLHFPLLVAAVELVVAGIFETRVALALGRRPSSRLLAGIIRYVPRPKAKPRDEVVISAVLLALYQAFPLSQERLYGGSQPPDHVAGVGVIVVEVLFGAWLWLGTRPGRAEQMNS